MRRTSPFRSSFLCLFLALLLSLAIGSVFLSPTELWNTLLGRGANTSSFILWKIRLPRTILVAVTGASLGGSGASYQGLFRNPLADPFLIGVASGAGLGAVIAMSIRWPYSFWGLMAIPMAAFLAALLTVFIVYLLARVGHTVPTTNLILAGVAFSSFATSLTSFLMLRSTGEVRRALGGIDLVAMCVNDLVVQGAEPLFFLDYYATGHLHVEVAADVIKGIADGCEQAGCALIGGETAETPGMYQGGDYDLAGFAVGVVEKSKIIDGSKVKPGDVLIGLASSGPHSNGYSLVRKVIEVSNAYLGCDFHGRTLGETLLAPTKIYIKPLLKLFSEIEVHALAHITGGGLLDNNPRVLPANTRAVLDGKSWSFPPVFQWLQQQGNIAQREMYRTFNCGVGMVIAVDPADADKAIASLNGSGEQAWRIGHIDTLPAGAEQVEIRA